MNNHEKDLYLSNYIYLLDRYDILSNELYNVKAISFDDSNEGYSDKTIVDRIYEKDRIEEEINIISSAIERLKDEREKLVLILVYREGLTLKEIQKKKRMYYSYAQLKRIKQDALSHIDI